MNDIRHQAFGLLQVLFNGKSPAAFDNFFAYLCENCDVFRDGSLYELANKCFDELAQREAEKAKKRLFGRLDAQWRELEEHSAQ